LGSASRKSQPVRFGDAHAPAAAFLDHLMVDVHAAGRHAVIAEELQKLPATAPEVEHVRRAREQRKVRCQTIPDLPCGAPERILEPYILIGVQSRAGELRRGGTILRECPCAPGSRLDHGVTRRRGGWRRCVHGTRRFGLEGSFDLALQHRGGALEHAQRKPEFSGVLVLASLEPLFARRHRLPSLAHVLAEGAQGLGKALRKPQGVPIGRDVRVQVGDHGTQVVVQPVERACRRVPRGVLAGRRAVQVIDSAALKAFWRHGSIWTTGLAYGPGACADSANRTPPRAGGQPRTG
jgi:hypothetical protein